MTENLERLNQATASQGITWHNVGGMFPVQAEGRDTEGRTVYFRFRHNSGQLYVGVDDDSIQNPDLYAEVNDVYSEPDGSLSDHLGFLDADQLVEVVLKLVALLKPPMEWEGGTRRNRLATLLRAYAEALQEHQFEEDRDGG